VFKKYWRDIIWACRFIGMKEKGNGRRREKKREKREKRGK